MSLLVYLPLSIVHQAPHQLLRFLHAKKLKAKDILNKKFSLFIQLQLLLLCYNFYKYKSKKLANVSQSSDIPTAVYGTLSGSNPVAIIFAIEKTKKSKDILNKKFLLLAQLQLLLLYYNFDKQKIHKVAVTSH